MRATFLTFLVSSVFGAACGPPEVESREAFIQRMEAGERARAEAVAKADQQEVEVSLRAAQQQESIRSQALAELTGQAELDPNAEPPEPLTYEELYEICGMRNPQCVVDNLAGGPYTLESLDWLAEAYDELDRPRDRQRVLRIRRGLE